MHVNCGSTHADLRDAGNQRQETTLRRQPHWGVEHVDRTGRKRLALVQEAVDGLARTDEAIA